jgi:hypothetical protein
MSTWGFPGSPLSQGIPRSVPEIPKRSRVRFGLFGPVTYSTSEVGAPAIPAGGGGGTGTASGAIWLAFGDAGLAAAGGPGAGVTAAWSCAGFCWGIAFNRDEISGPSFGSGALSFVPRGLRPVGGATGPGEGMFGIPAGGGTFASGAEHGSAAAGGA